MIAKSILVRTVSKYLGKVGEEWLEHQATRLGIDWNKKELDDETAAELAILIGTNAVLLIGKNKAVELQSKLEQSIASATS